MKRLLNRHFGVFIYLAAFLCGLFVLYQGRSIGLFPVPQPGMDQLSMLECAGRRAGENCRKTLPLPVMPSR